MFLTRYMSAHVVKCLLYWVAAGAIHHINITYGSTMAAAKGAKVLSEHLLPSADRVPLL